jgi:hypothetical protein
MIPDADIKVLGIRESFHNLLGQGDLVLGSLLGKHDSLPPFCKDTLPSRSCQQIWLLKREVVLAPLLLANNRPYENWCRGFITKFSRE